MPDSNLFAVLDDALERTIRHVRIARLQQKQGGKNAAQATVAVPKRMNLQKHDNEYGNNGPITKDTDSDWQERPVRDQVDHGVC